MLDFTFFSHTQENTSHFEKKSIFKQKKVWAGTSESIPSVSFNQALWKKIFSHIRTFITIFFSSICEVTIFYLILRKRETSLDILINLRWETLSPRGNSFFFFKCPKNAIFQLFFQSFFSNFQVIVKSCLTLEILLNTMEKCSALRVIANFLVPRVMDSVVELEPYPWMTETDIR